MTPKPAIVRSLGPALAILLPVAALGACGDGGGDGAASDGGGGIDTGSGGSGAVSGGRVTAGQGAGAAPSRAGASGAEDGGSAIGGRVSIGGRPSTGGRPSSGSAGLGRPIDDPGGAGGALSPPEARPDGKSPYAIECHGDSLACGDPALRCLGIRDTTQVFGYSCSSSCQTVDDCSDADSGAEASVGCVDFVSSKHCLLVCKDEQRGDRDCPAGMSCYVFPGSLIGYCLWQ